jgi:hypothetical protein
MNLGEQVGRIGKAIAKPFVDAHTPALNYAAKELEDAIWKLSPLKIGFKAEGKVEIGIPQNFDLNIKLPQLDALQVPGRAVDAYNVFQSLATDTNALFALTKEVEYMDDLVKYGMYPNPEEELLYLEIELVIRKGDDTYSKGGVTVRLWDDSPAAGGPVHVSPSRFYVAIHEADENLITMNRLQPSSHQYNIEDLTIRENHIIPIALTGSEFPLGISVVSPTHFSKYKKVVVSVKRLHKTKIETLHAYETAGVTQEELRLSFMIDTRQRRDVENGKLQNFALDGEIDRVVETLAELRSETEKLHTTNNKALGVAAPSHPTEGSRDLFDFVMVRAQQKERLLDKLWKAKYALEDFKLPHGKIDHRFRFKVELRNLSSSFQTINELLLDSPVANNIGHAGLQRFRLINSALSLPPYASCQVTFYPWRSVDNYAANRITCSSQAPTGDIQVSILCGFADKFSRYYSNIVNADNASCSFEFEIG